MSYAATVLADESALYWRLGEAAGYDPAAAYAAAVLTDAPLFYLPLSETSGTSAADATGNGFLGTYPGDGSILPGGATVPLLGTPAALFADSYGGEPGPGNPAGAGIALANPSALPLAPSAMTVEFWANLAPPAGAIGAWFEAVLWWGAAAGGPPYWICDMEVQSSAPAVFAPEIYEYGSGDVSPNASDPTAGWVPGTWHHVVLTWDNDDDPGGWAVYLDGAPWNGSGVQITAMGAQSGTIDAAFIGAGPARMSVPETLVGGLGHVALYDHALTAARALAHYSSAFAPVADQSGGGQDGRAHGGVTLGVPGLLRADSNSAATLDGSSGVIVQDESATLPTAASIEVWLQTTTTAGGVLAQFAAPDGSASDLVLYLRADGTPAFRAGSTEIARRAGGPVNDGRIYHLVATLDAAGDLWLYVNGNQAAHAGPGVSVGASFSGRWQIGSGVTDALAVPPASAAYQGTLDEFAVYIG